MKFILQQKQDMYFNVHCCSTEPGPQVPPQDGPLYGGWTTGQPLDVWRTLSFRGYSGKCLQVSACNAECIINVIKHLRYYCMYAYVHAHVLSLHV